nr:RNA pseudouridylate synthase domain-containing protein 1-like isoform X3 [Neodiprion pinetum]
MLERWLSLISIVLYRDQWWLSCSNLCAIPAYFVEWSVTDSCRFRIKKIPQIALRHMHTRFFVRLRKAWCHEGEDIREKNGNHRMCTGGSAFCERPRDSRTVLLVLETGTRNGKPATKVLLCPKTGRRHQLRVHCSHIGHTIIGDYTYSERQDTEPHRTFLHSFRLILQNEVENLDVSTADPFSSSEAMNRWIPINSLQVLDSSVFATIDELTSDMS